MWLEVSNLYTRVGKAEPDELEWLSEILSFEDTSKTFYRRGGKLARRKNPPRVRLFSRLAHHFPAGLTSLVVERAKALGLEIHILDARKKPGELDPNVDLSWLFDFQREGVLTAARRTKGIWRVATSGGKCLALDTMVLLHTGERKPARLVTMEDRLVGDDGTTRKISAISQGTSPMFELTFASPFFESWTCNEDHIVTVFDTRLGRVVDIPIADIAHKPESLEFLRAVRRGEVTHFKRRFPTPQCPYMMGLWLGALAKHASPCTYYDLRLRAVLPYVRERIERQLSTYGGRLFGFVEDGKLAYGIHPECHEAKDWFMSLGHSMDWFLRVPDAVKMGTAATRSDFLAGVLDGRGVMTTLEDGTLALSLEIMIPQVGKDLVFLARSLGAQAYLRPPAGPLDLHVFVVTSLPDRVQSSTYAPQWNLCRARDHKGWHLSPFKVEAKPRAAFVGFVLNKNKRFLLGDFQITHNTEMAVGLCHAVAGIRWLILVPEADLLHNAADRFELRTGEPCGRIGDGHCSVERVTVATFQTLANKLGLDQRPVSSRDLGINAQLVRDLVPTIDGVIFDEVHQLPADTFYETAMAIPAYYRIGMSGTPLARGDQKSLRAIAATGRVIHDIPSRKLIELGFAAKPTIYLLRHETDKTAFRTWIGAYSALVSKSATRNRAVVEAALVCPKPGLVFVKVIAHGRILTKLLRDAGLNVEFVWGQKSTKARDQAIEKLRWGDLDVIVCSVVFETGTDIPEVQSVINAAAGKSLIKTLQRIGRGMRVVRDKDGNTIKREFFVYDFHDKGNKWLTQWAKERCKAYMSEGHDVRVVDSFAALGHD